MKIKKIRHNILLKIFSVVLISSVSLILFILAIWGIIQSSPGKFYAHIHLIFTFVILIVVNAMVISFIFRKILKPLTRISESAEKIGKGNLDLQIPVTSKDELGQLAETFNKMTVDLKNMLQTREQLLLDVSHELRTPITRARLALEMMPDNSQKKSLSEDIRDMEIMITEILESERLKNGTILLKPEPFPVSKLLENLQEEYRTEKNRIKLFPVSQALQIVIDKNQMMMVLRNIINNSLKYSPEGRPVEISVLQNADVLIIRIEDFGPGIPAESLLLVFEPFYRADQSRSRKTGGYGLGLHLCKRIMDLHEAEIKLENKPSGSGLVASLIFKIQKD